MDDEWDPMPEGPRAKLGVHALVATLAIVFIVTGVTKLAALDPAPANFERWGYPPWFLYVVGILETGCAAGLVLRRTRFWSASLLLADMAGAFTTHLMNAEWTMAPIPVVLFILAMLVTYFSRPSTLFGSDLT